MNVIVDTAVWSLALRRHSPDQNQEIISQLQDLIQSDRVLILGAIRQEILSGIKNPDQFHRLRDALRAFPDIELHSEDYEKAADFFNICRQKGVQGSNTDYLICAVASRCNSLIFTADQDFQNFQPHIPIRLFDK
ncbi:MAG: PIN domain-containing protein [Synechococcaceae cyanobacterium SM2_3_2]|nr:PIN domain-containing protein [Synechococcaceae cyanobacterium SM2_3_2]